MFNKIRLGYHSTPVSLADLPTECDKLKINKSNKFEKDIRLNRTCMINKNHPAEVLPTAIKLAKKNITDLLTVLEWNETLGIKFFRISSDICPHISNWRMITNNLDYHNLAYSLEQFKPILKKIGEFVKKHGHRITFHPKPYAILNTPKHFTKITVIRELYWHSLFLDLCGLNLESTLTLHIGGAYANKQQSADIFVRNFNELPVMIKQRIIIENDETCYNVEDLLKISHSIEPYYADNGIITCIPVCFDYFHYCCWTLFYKNPEKRNSVCFGNSKYPQKFAEDLIPLVLATWQVRPKFHLSEQDENSVLGTHSAYIKKIPKVLQDLDIDLMLESRCREITVMRVRNDI